ncbi:MAG: hypothetical protein IPI98_04275 [Chitinophagaceae bacterium]|nr:hypothetical protein [Chitinophagaceae bacterium]
MTPSYARLKVNKTRSLTITHVASEDDDLIEPLTSGSDDMLSPLIKRKFPGGPYGWQMKL